MFSVHNTPEEFKNATITGHFRFVFEENWVRGVTWLSSSHKLHFKMSSVHTKTKAGVFKFFRFEERFRKAPFSWRIRMEGRPNRRNKCCVSKFLRRSVAAYNIWRVFTLNHSSLSQLNTWRNFCFNEWGTWSATLLVKYLVDGIDTFEKIAQRKYARWLVKNSVSLLDRNTATFA